MKINEIQQIEELSMNALPAIQTVFYQGWIIRVSNGYTKRANSITPLYETGLSGDVDGILKRIAYCEQILRDENINITYKITSDERMKELDLSLKNRGYLFNDLTSVQIANLADVTLQINNENNLMINERLTEEWLEYICAFNNISVENRLTLKEMLQLIIPTVGYFMLKDEITDNIIACGMCVLEEEYIGLFDVVTDKKYRGKGFGISLVSNILKWGIENGAKQAYLQVRTENQAALNLYEKIGFKEKYKYWYRIK